MLEGVVIRNSGNGSRELDVMGHEDALRPLLRKVISQSSQLLFSHASKVRVKKMPERKFASTGYRTQNHQVMSKTRSPLHHPAWALNIENHHLTSDFQHHYTLKML